MHCIATVLYSYFIIVAVTIGSAFVFVTFIAFEFAITFMIFDFATSSVATATAAAMINEKEFQKLACIRNDLHY